MPVELYPPIEPFAAGLLDVGDGNQVYWEACGNPDGKPAVALHGGPGSGCSERMRRPFDPSRYLIILFDQRGCGGSMPHASDPQTDMRFNTTEHLLADMEHIRLYLGIERWLLAGGSWGTTLALAYAQRFPHRVTEIVLSAVTTSRRSEIDWLYRGARWFFPEAWERFRNGAAEEERGGDLVGAYARLMESPDQLVRLRAATAWCAWEDAVLSLEPGGRPNLYSDQSPEQLVAFARICSHYFAHGAWLEEGALIRDAGRLAGIPGVLIHGRLDLSAPLRTAWELARAWPGSKLIPISDAGHKATDTLRAAMLDALDMFAR